MKTIQLSFSGGVLTPGSEVTFTPAEASAKFGGDARCDRCIAVAQSEVYTLIGHLSAGGCEIFRSIHLRSWGASGPSGDHTISDDDVAERVDAAWDEAYLVTETD